EWGIAVHQGTQYGWINRYLMLGGCIAVWLLAISALTMWWKRRPKGRLGAPAAPPGPRVRAAVLGIVLPLAIFYPMTGLSLLAALTLDRLSRMIRRRLLACRAIREQEDKDAIAMKRFAAQPLITLALAACGQSHPEGPAV